MKKTFIPCASCHALNRVDVDKAAASQPTCGRCSKALPYHDGVVDIGFDDLDRLVTGADIPVVVDLWAPWCGPCLGFAPVYAKVAKDRAGDFVFAKLNTEQHPQVTGTLGVRGIPTLIAFKNEDEVKRQAGAMPEAMLRQWLNDVASL